MRSLLVLAALAAPALAKPVAPVTVSITHDATTVTLIAIPSRAVPAIELRLDGQHVTFGPTRAGEPRMFTLPIQRTGDVFGSAVIGHRGKVAMLHLGPVLHVAPVKRTPRTLRNGRRVDEVRS